MTVPNPHLGVSQPAPQLGNPATGMQPQPFAQPHLQQPAAPQPQQYPQRPYVPPVYDAGPPKPPCPKLTKAAAHRARLAGGIGGGLTWLGLGITQLCAIFLLLPVIVGAVVFGLGFAVAQDGSSATASVWAQTLDWLGSGWGIVIAIGIPAGVVVALLGLWLSTRMLRHPGLRRPVGITWAGFGIAVGGTILLSGLGSFTLPFFGAVPFGFDDVPRFDSGTGAGPTDEAQVQEWFAQGGGDLLQQIADPGTLLSFLGPWIAVGQLLALLVPIALSIFTWWWMAHAMRPAATDAADAEAADTPNASA